MMNKLTGIVIGLVAVGALVLGVVAYNRPAPTIDTSRLAGAQGLQGPQGERGEQGARGPQGDRGPAGVNAPVRLGAVASPDIQSPWIRVGGLEEWSFRTVNLVQGTTTPCAIQAPQTGTSTLTQGGFILNNSTTTATILTLAKASNQYATTTVLASTTIPVGGTVNLNINATSSTAVDVNGISILSKDRTFATSSWFVAGVSGNLGTGAAAGLIPGYVPSGTCFAKFLVN